MMQQCKPALLVCAKAQKGTKMHEVVSITVEVTKVSYDNMVQVAEDTGVSVDDLAKGAIHLVYRKPRAAVLKTIIRTVRDWGIDRLVAKYQATPRTRKVKGDKS